MAESVNCMYIPAMNQCYIDLIAADHSVVDHRWSGERFPDQILRVYAILEGTATIKIGVQQFEIQAGDIMFIPAHTARVYQSDCLTLMWLHLEVTIHGLTDLPHILPPTYILDETQSSIARPLISRILALRSSDQFADQMTRHGLLLQLVALLMPSDASAPSSGQAQEMIQMLTWVDQHVAQTMSVGMLADAIGLSERQCTRRCRHLFNTSPHRLIMQRRLLRVEKLLRQTTQSLASIADQTGFSDAFHLSKVFKQIFKTSPSHWRKQVESLKVQPAQL